MEVVMDNLQFEELHDEWLRLGEECRKIEDECRKAEIDMFNIKEKEIYPGKTKRYLELSDRLNKCRDARDAIIRKAFK